MLRLHINGSKRCHLGSLCLCVLNTVFDLFEVIYLKRRLWHQSLFASNGADRIKIKVTFAIFHRADTTQSLPILAYKRAESRQLASRSTSSGLTTSASIACCFIILTLTLLALGRILFISFGRWFNYLIWLEISTRSHISRRSWWCWRHLVLRILFLVNIVTNISVSLPLLLTLLARLDSGCLWFQYWQVWRAHLLRLLTHIKVFSSRNWTSSIFGCDP